MDTSQSPEIILLLMACALEVTPAKEGQIMQFLDEQQVDWERLYILATRHRITPFLYRTLRRISSISETFLARLRQDCQLAATDNLLKLHEYHTVETILAESNLPYIALKGVYLAENYYPDSSLRISGDIDILIQKEGVAKAIQVLEASGYQLSPKHRLHWQQGEPIILHDLFEVSLFKPFYNGSRFDIDLHWQVMAFNQEYALFDLDYVRTEPTYSAEREVILLVVHHGVNNIWQQIYYINDLYFFLHKKTINWGWLMQGCRRYGLEQVFLVGLFWCKHIWELTLPVFIEDMITSAKVAALAKTYAAHWEREKPHEFSHLIVQQLALFAQAQTSFGKQLKVYRTFLSSRVFRYSLFHVGKRRIYVPKEAGLITLFIRGFQSLLRFLSVRR